MFVVVVVVVFSLQQTFQDRLKVSKLVWKVVLYTAPWCAHIIIQFVINNLTHFYETTVRVRTTNGPILLDR